MDNDILKRLEQLENHHKKREEAEQKKGFMDKYGAMFSGDEGIGTQILAELNRAGYDTHLADQVVQDMLNQLRQHYTDMLNKINVDFKKQQQEASDAMDKLNTLSNAIEKATGKTATAESDPAQAAMEVAGADGGMPPPPDAGGMPPPPDAGGMPPPPDAGGMPPPPDATGGSLGDPNLLSDERMKDILDKKETPPAEGADKKGRPLSPEELDDMLKTLQEISEALGIEDNEEVAEEITEAGDEGTPAGGSPVEEVTEAVEEIPEAGDEGTPADEGVEATEDENAEEALEDDDDEFDLYEDLETPEIDTELVDIDGDDEADFIMKEIYKPHGDPVRPDGKPYTDEEEGDE